MKLDCLRFYGSEMEANICDTNHLETDVLLPPRKRFLAGFKKQSSNCNGVVDQPMAAVPSPPSPSPSASSSTCSPSRDYNSHLNKLLSSHQDNADLSPEEMLEASRATARAAAKAAEAARATAEEKAEIAAKAVAAAKSALDLVASFNEETASKDRYLKKNRIKKHVPVQLLYKKHGPFGSHRTDEDLARRLHQVMNSSPRISKNGSSSQWKGHKHKRPESFPPYEKEKFTNGGIAPSSSNGYAVAGVIDSEDSTPEASVKEDETEAKYEKFRRPELGNGEAESSLSKVTEDTYSPSKKRGRVKLKTVPLSICYPKEDIATKTPPSTEKKIGVPTPRSKPLLSLEPSSNGVISVEAPPVWKCQEFKAPACIKQNKVMQ